MKIQSLLEQGHTKELTTRIVNYIGNDKTRFKELMQIFLKGEYRLTQRAAWPLSYSALEHPNLVKPYYGKLIDKLIDPKQHPAIARNILRLFQETEIPEKYRGKLLDACFRFIPGETYPIAIRAFAITVASKICQPYPELKNELAILLRELMEFKQTPALNVRIKRALKEL
jgi:hypothetical protein